VVFADGQGVEPGPTRAAWDVDESRFSDDEE
jgi:hypothetical protein